MDSINQARIVESFSQLPLGFEPDRGRLNGLVARGAGYSIHLTSGPTSGEATLELQTPSPVSNLKSRIRLRPIGAITGVASEPLDPLPGRSNYFIGNDPREWRTDIPNYSKIRYRNLYRGIDLVYYGNQRQLEYDFIVAPHEDPRQIALGFEGADAIELESQGDLLLKVGDQQLRMRKPIVYQEVDGQKEVVAGSYRLTDQSIRNPQSAIRNPAIGFQIGEYDRAIPLIIDPVVDYATYFGGSGTDVGYGIAIDAQNNVYVTGQTSSPNLTLKNALDDALEGANDAFVVKLNPQGNTVVFSTYIGGRNHGDRGWAIAVDRAGNVYFTGETNSLNFPTVNAAQPTFRGGVDGFVAKLNIEGNVLLYSSYLGGGFTDVSYSIALDRFDNAYITGRTESANFPVRNPLQDKLRGQRDAFVAKFSADGGIIYSTYLGGEPAAGGRDEEVGYGIAADALQNAYVVGYTTTANFPTANAIQRDFGGVEDAFVAKLNAAGSGLVYSTYLGGARADNGRGIAVDALCNAYVVGYTLSQDFPRVEALQPVFGGSGDGFVAKINAVGSALHYSTYLGGNGDENSGIIADITPSCAIAVDALGNAYVTGKTESQNFPVVRAINPMLRGDNDAYLAKLDPAGSELIYSTFLGSTFTGNNGFDERGLAIAVTRLGTVFLTGQVLKNDYQTVAPVQGVYGGGLSDAFITKISAPDIPGVSALSAASFTGGSLAPESIVAIFGSSLAAGTESANMTPLPTALQGTSVTVKDKQGVERAAPLFFVSPGQVNFLLPPGAAAGKAQITITNSQNNSFSTTVLVEPIAPGLFSADATGQGLAAAVAVRVKADGSQTFEPVVQLDGFGRLIAAPIDLGPESDQVFLILFGTGWRGNASLSNIVARIGDADAPVSYAGPQGSFIGEDQINLRIPRSLAGRGNVAVIISVEGKITNLVNITIR
ncbi:MAG: SBBP repeat-containing protein [Blastocatellia bacterium]